jgi:hypothetical protein
MTYVEFIVSWLCMSFTVLLVSTVRRSVESFKGVFLQYLDLFYDRRALFYQYAMPAVRTPDTAVFRLYFDLALTAYTFINREITSRISLKAVLVPRSHGE